MNEYDIPYEYYPFDMNNLNAKFEKVRAENLESAFEKVKAMYGDKIEIFKAPARKFYKE